jgi:hypothetical protein
MYAFTADWLLHAKQNLGLLHLLNCREVYRKLNCIRETLGPSVPILAVTATATPRVQDQIMKSLGMTAADTQQVSQHMSQQSAEPMAMSVPDPAALEHPRQEPLK